MKNQLTALNLDGVSQRLRGLWALGRNLSSTPWGIRKIVEELSFELARRGRGERMVRLSPFLVEFCVRPQENAKSLFFDSGASVDVTLAQLVSDSWSLIGAQHPEIPSNALILKVWNWDWTQRPQEEWRVLVQTSQMDWEKWSFVLQNQTSPNPFDLPKLTFKMSGPNGDLLGSGSIDLAVNLSLLEVHPLLGFHQR